MKRKQANPTLPTNPMKRRGCIPREDRNSVADTTLSIRLTRAERIALEEFIDAMNDRASKAYGPAVYVSMASFVRKLIVEALGKT